MEKKKKRSVFKIIFVVLITIFAIAETGNAIERFVEGWNSVECNCGNK